MDDIAIAAMDDSVVADIEHERLRAEHLPNVSTLSEREHVENFGGNVSAQTLMLNVTTTESSIAAMAM